MLVNSTVQVEDSSSPLVCFVPLTLHSRHHISFSSSCFACSSFAFLLDPPIRGVYRYTRNPVYAGVCLSLFGQAVYFVSGTLFFFTMACFVALHLLVVVHEEPIYRALYQECYSDYCRRVPR